MEFFTPDLYLGYNSRDDQEASRAEEEWESALERYRARLAAITGSMNPRVRELAEDLCLHDARLLEIKEADAPDLGLLPAPISTAILSLRKRNEIITLVYFLWDEIGKTAEIDCWPFAKHPVYWLYDEIGLEPGPTRPPFRQAFRHRCLLSDGVTLSIPFFDVVVQTHAVDGRASVPRWSPESPPVEA